MNNGLIEDLAVTLEDPRLMSDEELEEQCREDLALPEPPDLSEEDRKIRARAREILQERDRIKAQQAAHPEEGH